jgi:tetratricopeptide (TPR) repeat protein
MEGYHYGRIIREGREACEMTQEQLAAIWHGSEGVGVSTRYVQEVEAGRRKITDTKQLRYLSEVLNIALWKFGYSEYDPFNTNATRRGSSSMYDETLNTAESLIKRTWHLRRVTSLPYVEEGVEDINRLFAYLRENIPPPQYLEKRYQILYAQVLRINAVMDVENKRYDNALKKFEEMNNIATMYDDPSTLAISLLGIGTELDRAGRHQEAIEYLETARDEAFRASKHVSALINAYLARAYASNNMSEKFKKAISTARKIATDINLYYGDGTDFVFHSLSGILAEQSYGYLQINEPQSTLDMKDEIKKQIETEGNVWLDAWIPLDWARAYLMLGDIDESVEQGRDFYHKATSIKSPHAKSRAFKLLNTMNATGYENNDAVKNFRDELASTAPELNNTNDQYQP